MTPIKSIDDIFSDEWIYSRSCQLWLAHMDWLAEMGFTRAREVVPQNRELPLESSGHEVVDALSRFIAESGYVNAHLGLTSSDIIDNVRLMQIRESLQIIAGAAYPMMQSLSRNFSKDLVTVGFTHWMPAAPILWSHRCQAWLAPLTNLLAIMPMVTAKKFGGPVGDAASIKLLVGEDRYNDTPFDWSPFDLEYPNNPFPLQSSDYSCEIAAVNWAATLMAQTHKIAADLRFLASRGLVFIARPANHAGSSSMPHKTNPYKWEKVCGIARSVSSTASEVWTVAAHNGLERTLDGSWQLKNALHRCFRGACYALETMASVDAQIDFNANGSFLAQQRHKISSDRDLTRRVIAGESRWSAYQQMLAQQNAKSTS